MEHMTLGDQEEDMMGHGHKATQPSAAALELAAEIAQCIYAVGTFAFDRKTAAQKIDAFMAAHTAEAEVAERARIKRELSDLNIYVVNTNGREETPYYRLSEIVAIVQGGEP